MRYTVHKHRNLLAHAPERLHEEITANYNGMIYAATREEVETRRKPCIRKWRLKHRAVADSLQEAGERLFSFTRLPTSQWRSVRNTNAIERLHEEFKRRIKTQTVLPSADTAATVSGRTWSAGTCSIRPGISPTRSRQSFAASWKHAGTAASWVTRTRENSLV